MKKYFCLHTLTPTRKHTHTHTNHIHVDLNQHTHRLKLVVNESYFIYVWLLKNGNDAENASMWPIDQSNWSELHEIEPNKRFTCLICY